MKKSEIAKLFKKEAKKIWKSKLIDKIKIDVSIEKRHEMMALRHSRDIIPDACGDSLYRCPSKATVVINPKAMKLPKKTFTDLIRHETLHLGYCKHDVNFRRLAEQKKIPVTFSQALGGKYKVQQKIGSRYQTVKEFNTLQEARIYFYNAGSKKFGKWRIIY